MTTYIEYNLSLTEGQKKNLHKAYTNNNAIVLHIKYNSLRGDDELMLTNGQINKIIKAQSAGKGVELKISKTQVRKVIKKGGNLWTSILSLGTKILPFLGKAFGKAAPALATGATQAAASFGVEKALGGGCYDIPYEALSNIIPYQHILNDDQQARLNNSLKTGSGMQIRTTKAQQGGFLGTLLASIGIPMLIKAFTGGEHGKGMRLESNIPWGRGMQLESNVPRRRGRGMQPV